MPTNNNEPNALIHTDQATVKDQLGYAPYRDTLLDVIRRAETPLTVGVFGAWGSGKTSLLLMLQDALREAQDEPRARTVWFNAWQYSQEMALWRALISRVLEALRPPKPEESDKPEEEEIVRDRKDDAQASLFSHFRKKPQQPKSKEGDKPDKKTAALARRLDDLQASLYRDVDREETGGFEVDWYKLAKGGLKGAVKFGLSYIPGVQLLDDLVAAAGKETEGWAKEVLQAFQREKTRTHVDHVKFLEQFRDRFQSLVNEHVLQNGERMVIFVDDLDRCLPEKAIEVLEAIKLFLDVKGCVFVIAVDRDVVVKGIRVKYRDFVLHEGTETDLPISGSDYLEKIIQLPFYLPPVSSEDMIEFMRQEVADLPDACAEAFALGVEANPRKIKRTLNVFWMHNRLAEHRPELRDVIKPVRLAKVVVIQSRYPELYRDWVEAPLLLRHLEERFLEEKRWEEIKAVAEEYLGEEAPLTGESRPPEVQEEKEATEQEGEPVVVGDIAGRDITHVTSVTQVIGDIGPAPYLGEPKGPPLPPALDSKLVRKWVSIRPLRRMLLHRAGEKDMGFAGMEQEELKAYIYLTSTTMLTEVSVERPDERTWEDLLGNDFTRVQSAVGRIPDDERPGYVRSLLGVIAPGTRYLASARISAGTALDLLGDPRGFDELVEVPAGEFLMGFAKDDREARDDEKPQHSLTLTTFYIGKYPVTNAQYKRFIEDNPQREVPRHWDTQRRTYPEGKGNHPVVNVSWHDAYAYCQWLAEQTGRPYRLPTEAEWEKAARGMDGRTYPWGQSFDPELANTEVSGVGDTTPVGVYPDGVSPYGCADMAGNVWEWTASRWGKSSGELDFRYPYDETDGREDLDSEDFRVLRGGSFYDKARNVRCAYRHRHGPDFGATHRGFRVAVTMSSDSA